MDLDLVFLESASEYLAKIVFWWIHAVDGIPEDKLAIYTYVGGSLLVLFLLFFVLKMLPKALRGIVWVISAAILLTPGATLGETGQIAPAIIGVFHGLLLNDMQRATSSLLLIVAMIIAGLILGAIFQLFWAVVQKAYNNQEQA